MHTDAHNKTKKSQLKKGHEIYGFMRVWRHKKKKLGYLVRQDKLPNVIVKTLSHRS